MFALTGVAKRKYAVFGLGATGQAAAAALVNADAEVYSWDEARGARAAADETTYPCSHPKEWPWSELQAVVLSPGVPLTHPEPHVIVRKARQENVPVIGDIELFARTVGATAKDARPCVVAVTGSNGKSTTTALIGHILREAGRKVHVGGNIGEPVLRLPPPTPDATYVLELSSYQLDLCESLKANSAVFLNLSPDHLDRHGSMEAYFAAKRRIFANQTADDLAVIGVDDVYAQAACAELAQEDRARVTPISSKGALGRGVFALNGKLYYRLGEKTGEAGDISGVATLAGGHNQQNAAAALAVAIDMGVAPAVAIRSMERFKGLPHRSEIIARQDGVLFVNDSKATNAAAAAQSLSAYDEVFWIAGGRAKEGGLAALRQEMPRVRAAYLIGEAGSAIEEELGGYVRCVQCGGLDRAVATAINDAFAAPAPAADVKRAVLLAPGCASHDQFRNFEDRGEAFRLAVQTRLAERVADASSDNGEAA
ncbi:MAG: UDP-N-acetylmuramoyl-L-alanine--D-glutamate ligase [Pseudomonadota bacterium]